MWHNKNGFVKLFIAMSINLQHMRKAILFVVAMLLGAVGVRAQIPAEVTAVMDKCRASMVNPNGLEYEMDIKAGVGPVAMKMHMVVAEKGKMSRTIFSTRVLGNDIVVENGFDGTDTWENEGDTITITRGDHRKKNKNVLSTDFDKRYRKAKMKEKDGYYVITFTEPKDKDNEAKSVTTWLSMKSCMMQELKTTAKGASVTMKVTKIRTGLKDDYFKVDLGKFPNAVVIKK
jgi:hypothetical protein